MKKYIYTTVLMLGVGGVLTSCSNDFLSPIPEGSTNEKNFWETDSHYKKAVDGLHKELNWEETFGRDLYYEETCTDDALVARSHNAYRNGVSMFTITPDNGSGSLGDGFDGFYAMMNRASRLIYHALRVDNPSPKIQQYLGEAYFIRAFGHFWIANRYGRMDQGVPFYRPDNDDQFIDNKIPEQPASVMDNYKMIIEDLDNAYKYCKYFRELPEAEWGMATKGAALALKAKVLVYMGEKDPSKFQEVPAIVDRLENECGRGLLDNFADVFTIAHEWDKEHIYSINSTGGENMAGSLFPGILLENKAWGLYNGWGSIRPSLNLYAEYDENDLRRGVTILSYGDKFTLFGQERLFFSGSDDEIGFQFNKYMEPYSYGTIEDGKAKSTTVSGNGNRPTTDLNVPILRFADMVLLKAEALIEMGKGAEAAKELNRLTRRAGLGNKYQVATIDDLMRERRLELAGEFTGRARDLKRWATKYPQAKARLEVAGYGIKHVNRGDPNSPVNEVEGQTVVLFGKTYKGVIICQKAKTYNPDKDYALPYREDVVIKSKGVIKQNKGY